MTKLSEQSKVSLLRHFQGEASDLTDISESSPDVAENSAQTKRAPAFTTTFLH